MSKLTEEHILTASVTTMACCVHHNICVNVSDPKEIDPKCDEDSDSVIILGGHEQMGASDIRNAIMEYI